MRNSAKDKITLTKLAKIVIDGFTELRQDVKDIKGRLDGIDARLDYIVKANDLKDLSKNS